MNPDIPHEGIARRLLLDVLERSGLTRKQLAERAGKHPSELTRIMRPGGNVTVGTLTSLLWHAGFRLAIGAKPLAGPPRWAPIGPVVIEVADDHDMLLGA